MKKKRPFNHLTNYYWSDFSLSDIYVHPEFIHSSIKWCAMKASKYIRRQRGQKKDEQKEGSIKNLCYDVLSSSCIELSLYTYEFHWLHHNCLSYSQWPKNCRYVKALECLTPAQNHDKCLSRLTLNVTNYDLTSDMKSDLYQVKDHK